MLNPAEIRRRLAESAQAAFRRDAEALAATEAWLTSAPAREWPRIDAYARTWRVAGPTLGDSENWTAAVLAQPSPVAAVLASMHYDGYVRERAMTALSASQHELSDLALAVRVTDHVPVIREAAARAVLARTSLAQAERIMPVLHRLERRERGADVGPRYLRALVSAHGDVEVWARFRSSHDRDLRRAAYRHSIEAGLLGLADAVRQVSREGDPIVRRSLTRLIVDQAPPDIIADALLHARSAETRAEGLVRLAADQLEPAEVERFLVDRSGLVRLWARRRWREIGRDPVPTYAAIARSDQPAAVRARAYMGLAETGAAIEPAEVRGLVASAHRPLQKVGLRLLTQSAVADDVPRLLSLVAGESSRLARLASEVLARNPLLWSVDDLARLKASGDPDVRRRAWWIHRQRGGWESTIADLEVLHDPDPHLASCGRDPVTPMYLQPTEAQRRRIASLLRTADLPRDEFLSIALAAGLRELVRGADEPEPA